MTRIILMTLFIFFLKGFVHGQGLNWQNKDLELDGVFGISTDRVYKELTKKDKANTVIVAIIDSGVDISHEDLKGSIWTSKENGSHGWNYIGSEVGKEDITNLVGQKKEFYDSLSYSVVPEIYRAGYQAYRKLSPALAYKIKNLKVFKEKLDQSKSLAGLIVQRIGRNTPTMEDFVKYQPQNKEEKDLLKLIVKTLPAYKDWEDCKFYEIDNLICLVEQHLENGLNLANNEDDTVAGTTYVNPDAIGLVNDPDFTPYHGTHVAGIVSAARNNSIGIDGIADNVKLMILKVYGNIRELRDRNLAEAIRYAADNGARIINMSFGKTYTWNKKIVDDAVAYATSKDILIVHGAGNDGENLDEREHYPNPIYLDKGSATERWIEVGASSWKDDSTLLTPFSNYGKKTVDVFAPGMHIYSTIPGSKYEYFDGTSMATPVVTGLAALIMGHFPNFTSRQVKDIIMKSVTKVEHCVMIKGMKIPFKEICLSGGIVNAYKAFRLAAMYR